MNRLTRLEKVTFLMIIFTFFICACTSVTTTTNESKSNDNKNSDKHSKASVGRVWVAHPRRH